MKSIKSMIDIVGIFIGISMIAGLLVAAVPAASVHAQTTAEDLLGIDDLDELLDIGDPDDVLGLRLGGITRFVHDDLALRDVLLARITRLLVLRSQLLGEPDGDEILDIIDELEEVSTLRLLLVHRILLFQFGRLSLLGFERDDVRDLLMFRGLGFRDFLLLGDFELEDTLEDLRLDFKDILFRRNIDLDATIIKIERGLGLRRFFLRRGLDKDDLEDKIRERKERFFPPKFREREDRLRDPKFFQRDDLREARAREREEFFRQRFDEERERRFEREPVERPREREIEREPVERPREREIEREPVERPREREIEREPVERPREREVAPRERAEARERAAPREQRPARERQIAPSERPQPRERAAPRAREAAPRERAAPRQAPARARAR
jgi:hypothetical protein